MGFRTAAPSYCPSYHPARLSRKCNCHRPQTSDGVTCQPTGQLAALNASPMSRSDSSPNAVAVGLVSFPSLCCFQRLRLVHGYHQQRSPLVDRTGSSYLNRDAGRSNAGCSPIRDWFERRHFGLTGCSFRRRRDVGLLVALQTPDTTPAIRVRLFYFISVFLSRKSLAGHPARGMGPAGRILRPTP
jgi:hypothetical protein